MESGLHRLLYWPGLFWSAPRSQSNFSLRELCHCNFGPVLLLHSWSHYQASVLCMSRREGTRLLVHLLAVFPDSLRLLSRTQRLLIGDQLLSSSTRPLLPFLHSRPECRLDLLTVAKQNGWNSPVRFQKYPSIHETTGKWCEAGSQADKSQAGP